MAHIAVIAAPLPDRDSFCAAVDFSGLPVISRNPGAAASPLDLAALLDAASWATLLQVGHVNSSVLANPPSNQWLWMTPVLAPGGTSPSPTLSILNSSADAVELVTLAATSVGAWGVPVSFIDWWFCIRRPCPAPSVTSSDLAVRPGEVVSVCHAPSLYLFNATVGSSSSRGAGVGALGSQVVVRIDSLLNAPTMPVNITVKASQGSVTPMFLQGHSTVSDDYWWRSIITDVDGEAVSCYIVSEPAQGKLFSTTVIFGDPLQATSLTPEQFVGQPALNMSVESACANMSISSCIGVHVSHPQCAVIYIPNPGAMADSFVYALQDASGDVSKATVSIQIAPSHNPFEPSPGECRVTLRRDPSSLLEKGCASVCGSELTAVTMQDLPMGLHLPVVAAQPWSTTTKITAFPKSGSLWQILSPDTAARVQVWAGELVIILALFTLLSCFFLCSSRFAAHNRCDIDYNLRRLFQQHVDDEHFWSWRA